MIEIKTENLLKIDNNYLSGLTDIITSEIIEIAKKELELKIKDAICENHKLKSKGTILLRNNGTNIEFDYLDFCCENFKSKFKP